LRASSTRSAWLPHYKDLRNSTARWCSWVGGGGVGDRGSALRDSSGVTKFPLFLLKDRIDLSPRRVGEGGSDDSDGRCDALLVKMSISDRDLAAYSAWKTCEV
jgi:hypothetical protein